MESGKSLLIENEGALFRGPARAWPKEVWDGEKFVPYTGNVPKDVEWGNVVSDVEAEEIKAARLGKKQAVS